MPLQVVSIVNTSIQVIVLAWTIVKAFHLSDSRIPPLQPLFHDTLGTQSLIYIIPLLKNL